MSSGCFRRKISASGSVSAMLMIASISHACRQPPPSMKIWVIGMNAMPPMPNPVVAMASARPRCCTNHFATGTDVSSPPGAERPMNPISVNSPRNCHEFCTKNNPIMHAPVVNDATAISSRAPCRSSSRPRMKPEIPPASIRVVCDHPMNPRDISRSSPMGMTNSPKLSVPVAIVAKFTRNRMTTITHP